MNGELLYLNGEFLELREGRVHVEDRGFQLGDGIYEVIKVMNGRLVWLDDHLARLDRSLAAIRLGDALEDHDMGRILPDLVARAGLGDGSVYLQVTRGDAPREFPFPAAPHPTVLAYTRPRDFPLPSFITTGITLHPVEDLRWGRCDIKSTNLLAAVLVKQEAQEAGAWEALFMAPDGTVREGGSSNVFAVLGGVVRTHPLDRHILGGITRLHVLEIAHRLGIPVEERAFTLEEVRQTAAGDCEFFSASSTTDMLPVVAIGGVAVRGGRPGPVTLRLLDEMRAELAALAGREKPPALLGPP